MRTPVAVLFVCLALAPDVQAAGRRCGDDVDGRAVACGCGDVLVGSRTLTPDDPVTQAPCPGTGLLVVVPADRPAATLALAGHTLAGSGRGVGIRVISGGASGLTVAGPGIVRGFATGLVSRGAVAAVRDLLASDNTVDGFALAGDGYEVENCEASRNQRSGFVLGGTGFRVDGNRALDNGHLGFRVTGRHASLGEALGNEAAANRRGGLSARGHDLHIVRPAARANGGPGVQASGAHIEVRDATADDNARTDLSVHGSHIRDAGGHRADTCRGVACR